MQTRKKYVGSMNTLPLSRMPRRLTSVIRMITTTPISALNGMSRG